MRFLVRKLRHAVDWLSAGQSVYDDLVQTLLSRKKVFSMALHNSRKESKMCQTHIPRIANSKTAQNSRTTSSDVPCKTLRYILSSCHLPASCSIFQGEQLHVGENESYRGIIFIILRNVCTLRKIESNEHSQKVNK